MRCIFCIGGKEFYSEQKHPDENKKELSPGGIGKTRLLQEVYKRHKEGQSNLSLMDIIDFDDYRFQIFDNIWIEVSHKLGAELFTPYLESLLDYRKMQEAGISYDRLNQIYEETYQKFTACFNQISKERRVILFFDTTDSLEGIDFWDHFSDISGKLKNVLILIAGRDAKNIGKAFYAKFDEKTVQTIQLPPLREDASERYLQKKKDLLHIPISPELAQKLLILSGGKPILIDLAVEWISRNIPIDWLIGMDLKELKNLSGEEKQEKQVKFERELVIHIVQNRSSMDNLILLLSRVYPLDIQMTSRLLDISLNDAKSLFEDAKTYPFVKTLPNGDIVLHDEMLRLVQEYVWKEADPEEDRRQSDSRKALVYLEAEINTVKSEIIQFEEDKTGESIGNVFLKHEAKEQELQILQRRYIFHNFIIDVNKGMKIFISVFDEAALKFQFSFLGTLLGRVKKVFYEKFTQEQRYEFDNRQTNYFLNTGRYSEVKKLVTDLLEKNDISKQQEVKMLIDRGNAEIRLGHLKDGIRDFTKAVNISEADEQLSTWLIKAQNALGWAYRLTGDLENAKKNYHNARRLCIQQGGLSNEELKVVYCWISNNLAFVLSYSDKTCRIGIDIINATIEDWKTIQDDIGLGAAYLVLGVAYYRSDLFNQSLKIFQSALDIFEPLKHNDWLGQIYSWRGALYQNMAELAKAKTDLDKALSIGSSHIKAMTLNRLARVYMSEKKWGKAEQLLEKSLELSRKLPDYMYWLGAIERLAKIAAERSEFQKLETFQKELKDCLDEIKHPENNSLGMVYIALAKLAFTQNDTQQTDKIIEFLVKGIPLLTEYSTYARTGVLRCLNSLKEDFNKINPEIIRSVGKALQESIGEKEIEDVAYGAVTPLIYEWANWKGQTTPHAK